MSDGLPAWERQHYQAGGGTPWLYFVVFGDIDTSAPMSRSTYRSDGVPGSVETHIYARGHYASVPDAMCKGYIWDTMRSSNACLARAVPPRRHACVSQGQPGGTGLEQRSY